FAYDLRYRTNSEFLKYIDDRQHTSICTLSLHDALPIFAAKAYERIFAMLFNEGTQEEAIDDMQTRSELYETIAYSDFEALDQNIDRKSTRLNSSHVSISYAVFCLKKKNKV